MLFSSAIASPAFFSDQLMFNDVYPILEESCRVCHHNPGAPRGLSMETFKDQVKGSENGPVVVAGDFENSELIKRIKGDSQPECQ